MNSQITTQVATPVKAKAAYLVKQDQRQRFTFGNAWLNTVLAGVVSDTSKLVAHAVKLKVGRASDLRKLKSQTLLLKVQTAILAK